MISNWSKLGYVIGIIWSIGFAIRYLFIWQDYSQAITFVSIGLGLIALSWLYNKNLNLSNKLNAIEDYLADKK